jgi:hypothetical protein
MKKIREHRLTAWWLACFAVSLLFTIIPITATFALKHSPFYAHTITIRTNGNTGDIITAVENLKRTDLVISNKEYAFSENSPVGYLWMIIYLALMLALFSALVAAFEKRFRTLLGSTSNSIT